MYKSIIILSGDYINISEENKCRCSRQRGTLASAAKRNGGHIVSSHPGAKTAEITWLMANNVENNAKGLNIWRSSLATLTTCPWGVLPHRVRVRYACVYRRINTPRHHPTNSTSTSRTSPLGGYHRGGTEAEFFYTSSLCFFLHSVP